MVKKLVVVIPTLNEGELVRVLAQNLKHVNPSKLIFADSSNDGTDKLIMDLSKELNFVELLRVQKLGLGNGLRSGMMKAINNEADVIITMDADLSHNAKDILRFIEKIHLADIVIGSRYVEGGRIIGWGLRRSLMSKVANVISRHFLGIKAHDCSSNFRCYRKRVVEKILPFSVDEGYAIQSELLVLAQKFGYSITEVPTVFINRSKGKSKLTMREVFRFLSSVIRIHRRSRSI